MSDDHYREFGFLQRPIQGEFLGVKILPLSDHSERLNWVKENSNRDGFLYPPPVATYKIKPLSQEEGGKIENSEKPATVFKLLASHQISVTNPVNDFKKVNPDDVLIVNLLAYLFGTRLQFSDWNFDGRVPIKSTNDIFIYEKNVLHFLKFVYSWWRDLSPKCQIKYINILYVLTRTHSSIWQWEKFTHQYMVFDAIFNLYTTINSLKKRVSHRKRFDILFNNYGIPINEDLVNQIYDARNNLFHEALWGETLFGFKPTDSKTHSLPLYLGGLNSRLVCLLAGYKNEYSTSKWWTRQKFSFDRPNES